MIQTEKEVLGRICKKIQQLQDDVDTFESIDSL